MRPCSRHTTQLPTKPTERPYIYDEHGHSRYDVFFCRYHLITLYHLINVPAAFVILIYEQYIVCCFGLQYTTEVALRCYIYYIFQSDAWPQNINIFKKNIINIFQQIQFANFSCIRVQSKIFFYFIFHNISLAKFHNIIFNGCIASDQRDALSLVLSERGD